MKGESKMDEKHHTFTSLEAGIMEAFAIDPEMIEDISTFTREGQLILSVKLHPKEKECPACHSRKCRVHSYDVKNIKHSVLVRKNVILEYHARRYQCQECRRTFYEDNPFVFKRSKLSVQTVQNILLDLLDPACTYAQAGKKNGVAPTTAARIFDDHIVYPKPDQLPKGLLIDEVYALGKKKRISDRSFAPQTESGYVCLMLDFYTHQPLDVLDNRREETIVHYFKGFPLEERNKVKFVSGDMYTPYLSATKRCFKSARYAVDRFHVVYDANRKFSDVRTRVMKGHPTSSDAYYLLKKQNYLLNIPPDSVDKARGRKGEGPREKVFDPAGQRVYNSHFKRYLNRYELREMLLAIDPQIEEIYEFNNRLHDFYRINTVETAQEALRELIGDLREARAPEIRRIGDTLDNWYEEIVNSFVVVKEEYRVSSRSGKAYLKEYRPTTSSLERVNKDVKDLKRKAFGFCNFPRLRNRILYVLKKEPPKPVTALWKEVNEEQGKKK